jgi:hypothetical protein
VRTYIALLLTLFTLPALAEVAPAPKAVVNAFSALRTDPPPPALNRQSHFVVSDERNHELFHDTVADRGGVYVGVGTDQNYTMAAWAQAEVIVLMDFDTVVVDLHNVYKLAFLMANDAEDFIQLWHKKDSRLEARIEEVWPDKAERKKYHRAWRISRALVWGRLRKVRRIMKKAGTPHWLNEPAQFQWLVDMFKANRIYMVRGDLTAEWTVLDIAKAAKAAEIPVRVLYVSNAEAYFRPYPAGYKRNMAALPMDDKSVIIRTMGYRPDWSPDPLYEYNVQTGENFQLWMKHMTKGSVRTATRNRRKDKKLKLSFAEELPPALRPEAPKKKKARKKAGK